MFPVMKCGMACTIVPHSLYVLQNVQGADKRYNQEKNLECILCLFTRSF